MLASAKLAGKLSSWGQLMLALFPGLCTTLGAERRLTLQQSCLQCHSLSPAAPLTRKGALSTAATDAHLRLLSAPAARVMWQALLSSACVRMASSVLQNSW